MIPLAPLLCICLKPNSGETGKRIHIEPNFGETGKRIHIFFFFFAGKKNRGIINSQDILKD